MSNKGDEDVMGEDSDEEQAKNQIREKISRI